MKWYPLAGLACLAVLLLGCSHALEVRNLRSYESMQIQPLHNPPITVGIVPSTTDIESEKLIKGIGTALERHGATVIMPYAVGSALKPDVIANIAVRPEYRGSGWNFLINFPGFLVWAPAWHGYHYNVDYDMQVSLTDAARNTQIDSWAVPVELNVRHADMDRTWTEISWLEWGVIALVGGFVFINYDEDVTPLLVDHLETPLGDFIAQQIIARLNGSGIGREAASLPPDNREPPVISIH
ncbi:MAG TPA: hypothetical protein PK847_13775 [Candidatus Sumerlaeota bacterium]|nr:hypothetical protein [Candidatus Sumerlaeota bacterium]HOR28174.1 hypothetical protein [Candidatus Sumerlaeota bacterium]